VGKPVDGVLDASFVIGTAVIKVLHGLSPTSTCTAHSGATKAHDWMVSVLGQLFRTAGHLVRTQHCVTASAGQRRGDVEVRSYLRDQAGSSKDANPWVS
jgi:hypothetical protein